MVSTKGLLGFNGHAMAGLFHSAHRESRTKKLSLMPASLVLSLVADT
jgi:hypothetical protein